MNDINKLQVVLGIKYIQNANNFVLSSELI